MNQKNTKTILLVEDYKPIVTAYKDGLTRAGFRVAHLPNGRNVISKIKKTKPDLIILDLIMPEKDGFETLKEINRNPESRKIPVLILSNLYEDYYKQRIKTIGAKDYLIKSEYSMREIVEKINKII